MENIIVVTLMYYQNIMRLKVCKTVVIMNLKVELIYNGIKIKIIINSNNNIDWSTYEDGV